MVIAALGATTTQPIYSTQVRAPAPEEARTKGAQPPVASAATLVVERAPRLSFIYTKIDPNTGEEFWRWPTRPNEPAAPARVSAIGQFADMIA